MRIADIEVINLHFSYPNRKGFRYAGGLVTGRVTSLIRITTDSGLEGLGAAYSYPDLVRIIIEKHIKPHLLGSDPLEIEALWEKMYQLTRWYGRKGVAISALGGLDIAFWDLRGKASGQPLYKLLGGERNALPAYASGLFWQDDVSLLEKEAARHRNRGFRRVKMRLGRSEAYDMAAVEAARRGIASDGEVIVDGSHRFTLESAERMGKFLAAQKVFWFEEPFPPEDIDNYVALRPRLSIPLAAGENDFGVQGFRELLRAKALDIVQPDASRAGGITESMHIGRMAGQVGVRVAPHTWSDAVALIANAHVVAALPNSVTVEIDQTGNPFIEDLLEEPLRIKDGLLYLSDEPGLGVKLNRETVKRLAMGPDQMIPEGNYSDLIFGAEYWSVPPPYQASHQSTEAKA
jgi:L-alanine-DL-glutamate epimerase-like enolase superfamily enzyme